MFPFCLVFNQELDTFLNKLQEEKQYTPPARLLFSGDDSDFNLFVAKFVEHVLHIMPILQESNDF